MTVHHVPATPSTVRWGIFDAAIPPVVTVQSGDTVVLECVSGGPQVMPPPGSGFAIPPALAAIHASDIPRAGGHIITGRRGGCHARRHAGSADRPHRAGQ